MQTIKLAKEDFREMFLDAERCCCLCGSKLKFIHNIDHIKREVHEQALCGTCGIKNKQRHFLLQ